MAQTNEARARAAVGVSTDASVSDSSNIQVTEMPRKKRYAKPQVITVTVEWQVESDPAKSALLNEHLIEWMIRGVTLRK